MASTTRPTVVSAKNTAASPAKRADHAGDTETSKGRSRGSSEPAPASKPTSAAPKAAAAKAAAAYKGQGSTAKQASGKAEAKVAGPAKSAPKAAPAKSAAAEKTAHAGTVKAAAKSAVGSAPSTAKSSTAKAEPKPARPAPPAKTQQLAKGADAAKASQAGAKAATKAAPAAKAAKAAQEDKAAHATAPAGKAQATKSSAPKTAKEAAPDAGKAGAAVAEAPSKDGHGRVAPSHGHAAPGRGPRLLSSRTAVVRRSEGYTDERFLNHQRHALDLERATYLEQAKSLRAEAESLVEEMEPGDIQFDDESGEGGTVTVDRERDLALSAQALVAVDEIDHAIAKMNANTYGICENCGRLIPKARLEALPYARLCIDCKSGGLSRR